MSPRRPESRRPESRPPVAVRDLDTSEIEAAIDGGFLRGQQLIHFALIAGVVCFGIVVVGLAITAPPEISGTPDDSVPRLLSFAHPFLFVGTWLAGHLLHAAKTGPQQITRKGPSSYGTSPEQGALFNIAAADLTRVAMMESTALFGLVICLLAHLSGVLAQQPLYWFNVTSAVLMVAFVVARFPSHERYRETIRRAQIADRGGI